MACIYRDESDPENFKTPENSESKAEPVVKKFELYIIIGVLKLITVKNKLPESDVSDASSLSSNYQDFIDTKKLEPWKGLLHIEKKSVIGLEDSVDKMDWQIMEMNKLDEKSTPTKYHLYTESNSKLEETAITHALMGGVPDTKSVQNALTSEWQVSPELTGRLSGLLRSPKNVYDNTCKESGERKSEERENGRKMLSSSDILEISDRLDDKAIVCIALIASGLPRFDQVTDYLETVSIGRIISPVIQFAVYGVGDRALPAPRVPKPSAMRGSLVRLATDINEMNQLVNGFVRATTICFGWVTGNWMWRALGVATAYEASSDSKTDANYLTVMPAADLHTVGILAARVLANGVSLVLDNFNFGDRNNNQYDNMDPNNQRICEVTIVALNLQQKQNQLSILGHQLKRASSKHTTFRERNKIKKMDKGFRGENSQDGSQLGEPNSFFTNEFVIKLIFNNSDLKNQWSEDYCAWSATPSQPSCSASNPTSSKTKKRKYDESYLQYGFTCSSHNNEEQPVCLICKEVLAAESMKPSKLQRHLLTKHATLSKKPIEYFERLLQTSNKEKNTLEKYVTLNDKYLLASYEVSYLMAKTKKPFTIGEQLLLPAAIRMSEIVHGKQYAAEISKIPLSNDTVSKRISYISNDQFQQLLMRLKDSSNFVKQLTKQSLDHNWHSLVSLPVRLGGLGIDDHTCSCSLEYDIVQRLCQTRQSGVHGDQLNKLQNKIGQEISEQRRNIFLERSGRVKSNVDQSVNYYIDHASIKGSELNDKLENIIQLPCRFRGLGIAFSHGESEVAYNCSRELCRPLLEGFTSEEVARVQDTIATQFRRENEVQLKLKVSAAQLAYDVEGHFHRSVVVANNNILNSDIETSKRTLSEMMKRFREEIDERSRKSMEQVS
ncbi:hypothetical protein GJ496_004154 [Pomphorhynchus laevis]|nr:hypothetical protein GJ496_004154 [Pomphorhynchus laevis]